MSRNLMISSIIYAILSVAVIYIGFGPERWVKNMVSPSGEISWKYVVLNIIIIDILIVYGICNYSLIKAQLNVKDEGQKERQTTQNIVDTGIYAPGARINTEGNIISGYTVGMNLENAIANLKNDLIIKDINTKDIYEIERLLDQHLEDGEKMFLNKSIFEKASFYQGAAEGCASYGIWDKAILYGYKASTLYLQIPDNDSNPFIKNEKERKEASLYICAKFNFYANEVRKEIGKDYIYFLKELMKLAQINKDTKFFRILEEAITQNTQK